MFKKLWLPSRWNGEYRLAPSVYERITNNLKGFKNKTAAHKLAVWLARMNAGPKRLKRAFPIDRRVLCLREDIGLTEAQIRGAIATLLKVGFLDIVKPAHDGKYQRDERGVRKLPVQYVFAAEFKKIFDFIARKSKSPKDRQDSKLIDSIKTREAPPLGYLTSKLQERVKFISPRLHERLAPVDLSTVKEDGLRAALARLASFTTGDRARKLTEGGQA